MGEYISMPIPTLVTPKRRKRRDGRIVAAVPIVHPGVVRVPRHWQRYRPVVTLVPPLDERQPPVKIRRVTP